MIEISPRPYLIRAIYEWCVDNSFTPYLAVRVTAQTKVPLAYVKDGEIVLNISPNAVRHLQMQNDCITCSGRFNGVVFDIFVPVENVKGIYARENGEGLMFPEVCEREGVMEVQEEETPQPKPGGRPHLTVVK